MTAGLILILAGLLLVVYPPLLSIIVAALLMFAGAMVISIAGFGCRQQRYSGNATIGFFIRHKPGGVRRGYQPGDACWQAWLSGWLAAWTPDCCCRGGHKQKGLPCPL